MGRGLAVAGRLWRAVSSPPPAGPVLASAAARLSLWWRCAGRRSLVEVGGGCARSAARHEGQPSSWGGHGDQAVTSRWGTASTLRHRLPAIPDPLRYSGRRRTTSTAASSTAGGGRHGPGPDMLLAAGRCGRAPGSLTRVRPPCCLRVTHLRLQLQVPANANLAALASVAVRRGDSEREAGRPCPRS